MEQIIDLFKKKKLYENMSLWWVKKIFIKKDVTQFSQVKSFIEVLLGRTNAMFEYSYYKYNV